MRERGLADLDYFNSEILGYGKSPYNLRSECHHEMNRWLQDVFASEKQIHVMLEPRGHGKSILGGAGHTIWRICRNPNIQIRYMHADEDMAAEVMSQIRGQVENNDMLRVLYETELVRPDTEGGIRRIPSNTDDAIYANRTFSPRTVTLKMLGYKSGKIGTHVDLFVLDDLVNEKTCATPILMEGVKDFMRKIPPLLRDPAHSRVFVPGTRWDPHDAYGFLMEGDEFKDDTRKMVNSCFMDEAETIARWPEKYSVETLHKMEVKMTKFFFSANMRNEPIPRGSQLFDVEKVKRYDLRLDASMRPVLPSEQGYLVYTAVDPTSKDDGSGDAAVVLTAARDGEGNHFVLDIEYGHPNSIELVSWIRNAVQRWHPTGVLYEALCGQRMLIPWLKRDMVESGVHYPLQESTRTYGTTKPMRIRALAAVIETGRLYVPNSVRFKPLLREIEMYTGFSKAPKDDCLDCLADIYADGYDASRSKPKGKAAIHSPWQSSLLDHMIGTDPRSRRITSVESNRLWRFGQN